MSNIRTATHSGSWYSDSKTTLNKEIDDYLESAGDIVPGARVAVGPHAGYYYAGKTLAKAYRAMDFTNIERVFILGPSHHVYFKGHVLTTGCSVYETPIGNLKVDTEVIDKLVATSPQLFKKMSMSIDEDEHSFEMHMPFLYKVNEKSDHIPKVIPIMVSASSEKFEQKISEILKTYFEDKTNAFVISTDFCHWGRRFGYMSYTDTGKVEDLTPIPKLKSTSLPIYKSIEKVDKLGMKIISTGSYKQFKEYINETENTICGAKPLSILLAVMADYQRSDDSTKMKWVGYKQSSHVRDLNDSTVSYASGYAVI